MDESPDAVIATSPEGKVLYWSKGAEAIFGFSSAEALGRAVDEIIVPRDLLPLCADRALSSGDPLYVRYRTLDI
jgi:PAS domain S-box-containing protein